MVPILVPLLSKGGVVRGYTIVDAADAPFVRQWTWRLSVKGYACRFDTARRRQVYLHRELLNPATGRVVDHINRNKLDNRRENLRALTPSESNHNLPSYRGSTSPHRGVCWDTRVGKWLATGTLNRKHHYLGHFEDEAAADSAAAGWRATHMPFSEEATAA